MRDYKNIYLALDPGLTTGFSISQGGRIVAMGHLHSLEEVSMRVAEFASEEDSDGAKKILVYEDFARGNTAVNEQLYTIRVIGAILGVAAVFPVEVRKHYPSSRKGLIPMAKEMVRAQGYSLKAMHHAIDAIAHMFVEIKGEGEENWDEQYWLRKVLQSGG